MPPIPVLAPADSDDWDRLAEAAGTARATLMECAARASAALLADRYGVEMARGVVVAAGPGNNGGDGWALARALHRLDVPVWVASVAGERSELCAAAARRAAAEGVREISADGPWPTAGLGLDALLGTGARGAPRPPVAALAERLADLRIPLVALDGPTGVDLGTGVVHGTARADLSITFGGVRRGHLLARDEVGAIIALDIGHPAPDPRWPRLMSDEWACRHAPRLAATAHKGDRGRIVMIGGAPGTSGALRLAARAALAAGAGYVHAVAPPETARELRAEEPELLTLEQAFDEPPGAALRDLVARADVVLVGPGLGRARGRIDFVRAACEGASRCVLDADALTAFGEDMSRLGQIGAKSELLLTPHPGEFRTLFPDLASERELDPWGAAASASSAVGATILLKGVPSVAARDGKAAWTIAAGNPGLGTGGSGDVLSGIVSTLFAQTGDPMIAAACAAQALGHAGDAAARRVTARSMRPADVIAALPDVWREWERRRATTPAPRLAIVAELPPPARA